MGMDATLHKECCLSRRQNDSLFYLFKISYLNLQRYTNTDIDHTCLHFNYFQKDGKKTKENSDS